MRWATRHPFAPHIASLGLGNAETQVASPGIDAAMMFAQERRRATGQAHYVITQPDALIFSRPEYYTLDRVYFPGWAVINARGYEKLPSHVTTWWWPAGARSEDVLPAPRPSSSSSSGGASPVLPAAEGGGFAFSDSMVKALAVGGGVLVGAGLIWYLTR